MTLEKLQEALDRIPPTGAINRARRQKIIEQINQLLEG